MSCRMSLTRLPVFPRRPAIPSLSLTRQVLWLAHSPMALNKIAKGNGSADSPPSSQLLSVLPFQAVPPGGTALPLGQATDLPHFLELFLRCTCSPPIPPFHRCIVPIRCSPRCVLAAVSAACCQVPAAVT